MWRLRDLRWVRKPVRARPSRRRLRNDSHDSAKPPNLNLNLTRESESVEQGRRESESVAWRRAGLAGRAAQPGLEGVRVMVRVTKRSRSACVHGQAPAATGNVAASAGSGMEGHDGGEGVCG